MSRSPSSTSAAATDHRHRRRFHAQVDPHRCRRPDRAGRAAGGDRLDDRAQAGRAGHGCPGRAERSPSDHRGRGGGPTAGR
ncbi:hypothetical protein BMR86_19460, partial [Stenotrophomonas sp. KAs 5-3]